MIQAWFDGSCLPQNPGGYMAYGVAIDIDGQRCYQFSKIFQPDTSNTNNLAEYLGFKEILDVLLYCNLQDEFLKIYGDSNLVINQMFGTWKIKEGSYIKVAKQCKELVKEFPNIHATWIPKDKNYICHDIIVDKFKESGVEIS